MTCSALISRSSILSSLSFAQESIHVNKFKYSISLCYESSLYSLTSTTTAIVNGKRLKCYYCNNDPLVITIVYGMVEGYCSDHIPVAIFNIDLMNGFNQLNKSIMCVPVRMSGPGCNPNMKLYGLVMAGRNFR